MSSQIRIGKRERVRNQVNNDLNDARVETSWFRRWFVGRPVSSIAIQQRQENKASEIRNERYGDVLRALPTARG